MTRATDLITIGPAIDGVPMMDAVESREYLDMMRTDLATADNALGNFRARALDWKEREGWKALGYRGFIEGIRGELGTQYSKSYLSRLLKAAEIERVLELPIGNDVPESALRPIGQLGSPDQQRQAWQAATEAAHGTPTAKQVTQAVQAQQAPAPLPPLPADLASDWTRWRNDDGTIGMRTVYGFKLAGTDRAALESEARGLARPLAELAQHDWHVFYDPAADGRADLHAYTASHQEYEPIGAHDIPHLALAAWRARNAAAFPDLEDAVIDGLWLNGHDPIALAKEGLPHGELRYLAGVSAPSEKLTIPPPIPHLPADWSAQQRRARPLELFLEMDMYGRFNLVDVEGNGLRGVDYAAVLARLDEEEEQIATRPAHSTRGRTLPLDVAQRLVSAGAAIWGDGTVMPPKGIDEPQTVMDADAAEAALARWAAVVRPVREVGVAETAATAIGQARHLIGLLEAHNWSGAQHTCRLLCRTLGIEATP